MNGSDVLLAIGFGAVIVMALAFGSVIVAGIFAWPRRRGGRP